MSDDLFRWLIPVLLAAAVAVPLLGKLRERRARRRTLRRERPAFEAGGQLPAGDRHFRRLEALMQERGLFRDPELDEVSLGSALGLSRRQVRQLIRRHTGGSVQSYINGYRVRAVRDSLCETPAVRLGVLARRAGFRSRSSLYRAFRTRLGCSPTAWARRRAGR